MDLKAQAEPLGGGSFHGVSWRDRDRESNDLVNHIGGVFRYFIVDVVDPGSTPDVARYGRELEHMLIDSEGPRLEETRHMKKLPSETEESQGSVEAGCHVSRRKTVGRSSLQLHKFTEERFTRLRVTHKIRWWQAASIRKKGFRAVLDLQSQGVCDYMHWSFRFLHILQVIGTESIVEHKEFSHSLVSHGILGTRGRLRTLNDMSVSWLFQMFKSGSWVHERNGF
ncbi:hypothetical protein DY000_02018199 [Brassica cretica]|uniref:Uncharacterized protein n=1 Tax=Brassica cretica TaxID=69181 RepID=A0ABQ7CQH0_BRACR|nr:hypothetical protein DY000_02018199 [Brassica cretica]